MHYGWIAIMDFDHEFMILPFFSFFFLLSYLPLCYCAKLLLDGADKRSRAQQPELGDALAKNPVQFPGFFAKRERSETRAAGC